VKTVSWEQAKQIGSALAAQWQPIETAPKDKMVLCYWEDGSFSVSKYYHAKECWAYRMDDVRLFPTHWMPLPPKPKTAD